MKITDLLPTEIILSAILLVTAYICGKLSKWILNIIEKRLASKTKTSLDDKIITLVRKKITTVFLLIASYIIISELQRRYASSVDVLRILHFVRNGCYIFSLAYVAIGVMQLFRITISWFLDEQVTGANEKLAETVTPLLEKLFALLTILGVSVIVLDHFGVNIGSLLVSLGVGSLAIALAAQETIANMIAGIVIMIDRPFRVGDRIQLPSGETGDVEKLGLRSTRILNFDKNIIVVPNAELVKNRIVNYSYPSEMMRAVVRITVAYNSDVQKVKSLLLNLFFSSENILKEPKADVNLIDFTNVGMLFECIGFTSDYKKRFETETQLREKIIEAFRNEGIEIPTQQVVQMK